MRARLRVLTRADQHEVMAMLLAAPVENLFVLSRIASLGVDRATLGCEVYGYERDGRLQSLCHAGSNVVPINADADAIAAFAHKLGPRRRANSIMGRSDQVRMLWEEVNRQGGTTWRRPREIRARQPLMVIDGPPAVPADPRVVRVTMADFDAYFEAAVAMYTEEVGVSPLDPMGSYRTYVRTLIQQGRAFGVLEGGRVLFKADVGSTHAEYCQIQGVWVAPDQRGRGLSAPCMAAVTELVAQHHRVQSLYVNDFNTRARRLYERVGYRTVGEFATVLY